MALLYVPIKAFKHSHMQSRTQSYQKMFALHSAVVPGDLERSRFSVCEASKGRVYEQWRQPQRVTVIRRTAVLRQWKSLKRNVVALAWSIHNVASRFFRKLWESTRCLLFRGAQVRALLKCCTLYAAGSSMFSHTHNVYTHTHFLNQHIFNTVTFLTYSCC